ncbi:MAG: response regulator [Sphingorhabdus sp.]
MTNTSLLVVDDDELVSEMLAAMLALEGYAVATAENGAVGLDMLACRRFDLVLLDLVMPHMDGIRFLRLLPDRIPMPPPIIVVSASVTGDVAQAIRMPGVVGVSRKPVQREPLLRQIADALSGQMATGR